MSAISIQQLLDYMNQAITNPKKFSQYVKKQMDTFINQSTLPLKQYCNYATNQGKGAWRQAHQFLKNHKPLPPLQFNQGLNLAAMDHAIDMKNNGFFGHSSSNGMSFGQRIQRRCGQSYGAMAQNLGSDFDVPGRNHALQTIMGLVIDDGVSSRGHRKNMFNQAYKYCGIYAVKSGDELQTCIDFHSQNIKVIENSKSPLTGGNKGAKGQKAPQQFGNMKMAKDLKKQFEKMKINHDHNNGWDDKQHDNGRGVIKSNNSGSKTVSNSGGRNIVSKSTNTKTTTKNGKTTKITTTKIKYSDGSIQEQINQQWGQNKDKINKTVLTHSNNFIVIYY